MLLGGDINKQTKIVLTRELVGQTFYPSGLNPARAQGQKVKWSYRTDSVDATHLSEDQ